jgi:hypothetical protein
MKENCELWQRVKIIAENKGFIMVEECPADQYCTGKKCLMSDDICVAEGLRKEVKIAHLPIHKKRLVGKT